MQFANLRNFEIVLYKLEIAKSQANFEIVQRNFEIAVYAEEWPHVPMMIVGDANIDYQRQRFEAFCKERYANRNDQNDLER